MNIRKYKVFIKDTLLNIIATMIPLMGLQLVILPVMAKYMGAEEYGALLTIVSLITVISNSLGNSLNNIRLIQCSRCMKEGENSDYNLLLIMGQVVNLVMVILLIRLLEIKLGSIDFLCVILYALASTMREYYVVYFRIILNYKKIVISNIYLFVGYLLGYGIFRITGIATMIYVIGVVVSLVYVAIGNPLFKEKINKTIMFKHTSYGTVVLSISSFLESALNYADRLIIYPMIGGTAVSIYYTATLLGKVINSGVTPITSVVLSYISKKKKTSMNQFKLLLAVIIVAGVVGYIVCISLSKPILGILYPKWVDESLKYIYITTLSAICGMMISVVRPFVLKFCNVNWQLAINTVSFGVYLGSSILLFQRYGLYGFCIGVFISKFVKLLILCLVYYRKIIKDTGENYKLG